MVSFESRNLKVLLVSSILCSTAGIGVILAVYPEAGSASGLRTTESIARETSYTVTLSPVGALHFAKPPQRVVTEDANYNDMLVALGRGRQLLATGYPNNFFDGFYQQLPDTEPGIDRDELRYLSGTPGAQFDKELLYQLDADIHHIDPVQLATRRSWTKADVEEIARNVGPFFANRYSRENIYSGEEPYEFYSLWELAEKVGAVYQDSSRVARLKELSDALVARIQTQLPPLEERPQVGLVYFNAGGRFTPYSLGHGGFGQAHYEAVGARDAFAGLDLRTYGEGGGSGIVLDLEGLISINPDVLIMPFAIYGEPGSGSGARGSYELLLALGKEPLGQRLTAFQRDQVYPGGTPLQGPIFFIFQVEMAAKQLYPKVFGRYRDDQRYPPEECLFERAALAKIIRGPNDAER